MVFGNHRIISLHHIHLLISKKSIIDNPYIFSVYEWKINSNFYINDIKKKYNNKYIVVRSSAFDEDRKSKSLAGKYKSVLNVNSNNAYKIRKAIEIVKNSLPNKFPKKNQIFIQKQIINPSLSGVVFTSLIENSEPYYSINYEEKSNKTNIVTSGITGDTKIFYTK